MTEGLEVHSRKLIYQQAAIFTFNGDIQRFIDTGEMRKPKPIPYTPEQEALIAQVHANGGRLILDLPENKNGGPQ